MKPNKMDYYLPSKEAREYTSFTQFSLRHSLKLHRQLLKTIPKNQKNIVIRFSSENNYSGLHLLIKSLNGKYTTEETFLNGLRNKAHERTLQPKRESTKIA